MPSQTDIANMALSSIKSTRTISSLSDGSVDATQLRAWYEPTLEFLLRQHNWGFAQRVVRLALATDDTPGFRFTYTYPPDAVKVHRVIHEDLVRHHSREMHPFKVVALDQRSGVACDIEKACLEYTARTNEAMFSADFVQCFVKFLASEVAVPITGDAKIASARKQEAYLLLSNAKTNDLGEQYPEHEPMSRYEEVRMLGGYHWER